MKKMIDLTRVRAALPTASIPTLLTRPTLPRPGRTRRTGTGRADRLALTEVRDHLTFTDSAVTAWYVLPEQIWPFRSDAGRESLVEAIAGQYADLAGLRLHLRRTTVPFPIMGWANDLSANSVPLPDPPDTDEYGPGTWWRHLHSATMRLAEGGHHQGRTLLGVTFARPAGITRMVSRQPANHIDDALAKRIAEVGEMLAGAHGLAARPATPPELASLIYRSVGIGLDEPTHRPGNVSGGDIAEFVDNVDYTRGPYSATTRLVDRRSGKTAYVAVLTVGRMEELEIPQVHQPWLHLAEQAGFAVEISSRVDVLGPASSARSVETRLRIIRNQRRDYAEHGLDEPPELERLTRRAAEVGDQISTGLPVDAARAHGWHRLAVYAETETECLERVRELARIYDQNGHITLTHPKAQFDLLREFIPGEPVADTGYLRRMPVRLLAAGMPQAAASVGDNCGDLIGHTVGAGQRPVFYDPHFAMEVRERSGLAVFVSEPGGGKSTLLGALGYLNARRGVQVTLMDPSGPLARLCQMPELAPYSRVVNLVGAQRGTLAPFALIPTPLRQDFPPGPEGAHEYETAVANARAERKELALDIMQMILPPQVLAKSDAVVALRTALREVEPEEWTTLDDVVDVLDALGTAGDVAAKEVAGLLADASDLPLGRPLFGEPPAGTLDTDAALTVITMGGLQLPDLKIERQYWSPSEVLAVPMLHTAHRLAVRRCYSGDRRIRRFVGLDEAHFMNGWRSGRAFLIRLARDSRKWNIAAMVASQNPRDVLELDVQNLVSTVFVGRVADDDEIAAQGLRMLGVPAGVGYEAVLAGLSQQADTGSTARLGYREFVMRDVERRVQKIRVDVSYVHALLTTLDTTPGGAR